MFSFRKCDTSAICIPISKTSSFICLKEIASSKSFALSGSIVKVVIFVRSFLFLSSILFWSSFNSLAFFMVSQGAKGQSWKIVWLAGLLNLPYYLLLIAGTAILSEEIMQLAENTYFIFAALFIWLLVALVLDIKNKKS